MGEVGYLRYFSERDRLRVSFATTQGVVQSLVVQYEAFIEDEWRPVVRFDTAHGFFHMDNAKPDGEDEKHVLSFTDLGDALTFALDQIGSRWEEFRRRYEEAMR